jgi:hypothetical protein
VLLRALSVRTASPATREALRQVVFALLLAEMLAGSGARQRPRRGAFPARRTAVVPPSRARYAVPAARGSLAGRRPRG